MDNIYISKFDLMRLIDKDEETKKRLKDLVIEILNEELKEDCFKESEG